MKVFFSEKDNVLIVKITGELDHHNAPQIREETDFKIINNNIKYVIFDFTNLSFMDSSGVGVIIGRYKLLSSLKGSLYIVSPSKNVNRLLELSGIPKIIKMYKSIEEVEINFEGSVLFEQAK